MIVKNIKQSLHTMRSNRGRSLLTMLGVIIAVASVTTVVSIGHGIQDAVTKQANQYSKDVVTVRPAHVGSDSAVVTSPAAGGSIAALTDKDVTTISKVPAVKVAVPLTVVGSEARADNTVKSVVFAVSSDLPEVLNQEIAYGAFFTSREDSNNVAVLGADAADKLFNQKVPLGHTFTIRGQEYIVSGILDPFESAPLAGGTNFNDAIFVPQSAIKSLAPNGAAPVYSVLAKIHDGKDMQAADEAVAKALAKSRQGEQDFMVLSPGEIANESTGTFDLLTDLIIAAAAITLLVSGIGIMNVMLVSVTERIREIGIRKAVGATNRQILAQFVTEAATMSVVGSIIGAVLALVTVWLLRIFTTLTPVYDWQVAGLACVVACAFGILFGTLPAIKAARKDPITALRSGE